MARTETPIMAPIHPGEMLRGDFLEPLGGGTDPVLTRPVLATGHRPRFRSPRRKRGRTAFPVW